MKFSTSILSNIGGRDKNDDYADYVYKENYYGAWIVADGLGGYADGDIASKIAIDTSLNNFVQNSSIEAVNINKIFSEANKAVLNAQANKDAANGMRTTIVGLFTDSKK